MVVMVVLWDSRGGGKGRVDDDGHVTTTSFGLAEDAELLRKQRERLNWIQHESIVSELLYSLIPKATMSSNDAPPPRTSARLQSRTPSHTPQPAPQTVTMAEATSSATTAATAQHTIEEIFGDSDLSDAPDSGISGDEKSSPAKRAKSKEGDEGKVPSPRRTSPSRKGKGTVTASSSGEGVIRTSKIIHSEDEDEATPQAEAEAEADESEAERIHERAPRTAPKDRSQLQQRPAKAHRRPSGDERPDHEGAKDDRKTPKIKLTNKDAKPAMDGGAKSSLKVTIKTGGLKTPTPTPTPTADEFTKSAEPTTTKRVHSRGSKAKAPVPGTEDEEPSERKRKPERKEDDVPRRSRDGKSTTGKKRQRSPTADDVSDHRDGGASRKPPIRREHGAGSDPEGSDGERRERSRKKREGEVSDAERRLKREYHLSSDEDHLSDSRPVATTSKKDRSSDVEEDRERRMAKKGRRERTDGEHDDRDVSDHEPPRPKKNKARDHAHDTNDTGRLKKRVIVYTEENQLDGRKSGKKHRATEDEFFEVPTVEKGGKTPKTPKTPRSPGYQGAEERGEKVKKGEHANGDVEGKAEERRKIGEEEGKPRVRRDEEREGRNDSQDVPLKKKKNRPPTGGEPDLPSSDVEVLPKKKKPTTERSRQDDIELVEPPARPRLQKRPGGGRIAELGGGGGTRTPGEGKPRTPMHRDGQEVTPVSRRPVPPKKVAYDPLAAAMSSLGAGGAGPSSGVSWAVCQGGMKLILLS